MFAPTRTRKRRLLKGTRTHRHALPQRRLDDLRERGRFIDVARLRHFPGRELDVTRAAAENRQRLAVAMRPPLRRIAVFVETEIEDLAPPAERAHRRVGVQADEEVSLVVVRQRGALVEADRRVAVAGQDHAHAEPGLERRLQPPRHARA